MGLFRGGNPQPHSGANIIPPSSHDTRQPPAFPQFVACTGSRCGRKLDRDRHPHRRSRKIRIENSFHFATINTPGLIWTSLQQRHKLQHALLACRKYKWDILALTEMRDASGPLELNMVYVEEFLLLHHGRVAFLMPFHVHTAWSDTGCRWESPDPHLLVMYMNMQGQDYAFVAVYVPSGQSYEQRRLRAEVYAKATSLHQRLSDMKPTCLQIWGGDWNGHVGRDHPDHPDRNFALQTPTTPSGIEQRQWLSHTGLQVVDSRHRVGHRGTWCHPQNHKWYELDYFCATPTLAAQVQTIRTIHLGFSDHVAKQALFHLAKPTSA